MLGSSKNVLGSLKDVTTAVSKKAFEKKNSTLEATAQDTGRSSFHDDTIDEDHELDTISNSELVSVEESSWEPDLGTEIRAGAQPYSVLGPGGLLDKKYLARGHRDKEKRFDPTNLNSPLRSSLYQPPRRPIA